MGLSLTHLIWASAERMGMASGYLGAGVGVTQGLG